MAPAPELVERFRGDLAALWPATWDGAARLGLAVSGGADSLALLLLAGAALPGRIEAATVDHGLRAESAEEASIVAGICAERGIPHETLGVSLFPGNVQDRARAARYGALAEWCERRGLAALATGHQLDDQAETLVMRLNRGSGLAGLAGVRARGTVPGGELRLLRPLLGWRRIDLAELVCAAGLEPASDPSNADERFDRVRIRTALDRADWIDALGLARSAALLAEAEGFVADTIAEMRRELVRRTDGGWVMIAPQSEFAAVELAAALIAEIGGSAPRSEVATMVTRLRRGDNASLSGVLARVVGGDWLFAQEPPRRLA